MKKNIFALALLMAFLLISLGVAAETLYFIPGGSQKTTNTDYVVPTINCPSKGYLVPAVASFSIPADTAVQIPTLPDGTKQVSVYVWPSSDANFGPSVVASGTSYPAIASGSLSPPFTVGTTTPLIYFIGRSAAATGTLICE